MAERRLKVEATCIRLFDTDDSHAAGQRTYMIFGVPRGGTTAVAGLCQRLGLYQGEDLGINIEDKSMRIEKGLDAIRATVAARNAAHDVWGWKHPNPKDYIDDLLPDLRNPRLILVTRDLTANALGIAGRGEGKLRKALAGALQRTRWNMAFIRKRKLPVLLVSYEKLCLRPQDCVAEIAAFLGVEPSEAQRAEIDAFIKPGWYNVPEGHRREPKPKPAQDKPARPKRKAEGAVASKKGGAGKGAGRKANAGTGPRAKGERKGMGGKRKRTQNTET